MGSLLSLLPLKVSCGLRQIFLATVELGSLIWTLNLHPDFCLGQCLLLNITTQIEFYLMLVFHLLLQD